MAMRKYVFGALILGILALSLFASINGVKTQADEQTSVVLWWTKETSSSGEYYHTVAQQEQDQMGTVNLTFNMSHYKKWDISAWWGVGVNTTVNTSMENDILSVDIDGFNLVNVTVQGYVYDLIMINITSTKIEHRVRIEVNRTVDISFYKELETDISYETEFPISIKLADIQVSVEIYHKNITGEFEKTVDVEFTMYMNATVSLDVSAVIMGLVSIDNENIANITWDSWGTKTVNITGYTGELSVDLSYYVDRLNATFYNITLYSDLDKEKLASECEDACRIKGLKEVFKRIYNRLEDAMRIRMKWRIGETHHGKIQKGHGTLADETSESVNLALQKFSEALPRFRTDLQKLSLCVRIVCMNEERLLVEPQPALTPRLPHLRQIRDKLVQAALGASKGPLRVLDLACGRSYLGFVLVRWHAWRHRDDRSLQPTLLEVLRPLKAPVTVV